MHNLQELLRYPMTGDSMCDGPVGFVRPFTLFMYRTQCSLDGISMVKYSLLAPDGTMLPNARRLALYATRSSIYGAYTGGPSSYGSSLIPSFVMTFTSTPLKSIGNLLLNSSVHILKIFIPSSNVISG